MYQNKSEKVKLDEYKNTTPRDQKSTLKVTSNGQNEYTSNPLWSIPIPMIFRTYDLSEIEHDLNIGGTYHQWKRMDSTRPNLNDTHLGDFN